MTRNLAIPILPLIFLVFFGGICGIMVLICGMTVVVDIVIPCILWTLMYLNGVLALVLISTYFKVGLMGMLVVVVLYVCYINHTLKNCHLLMKQVVCDLREPWQYVSSQREKEDKAIPIYIWDLFLGGIRPTSDKHAINKFVKTKLTYDCIVKRVIPEFKHESNVFNPMFIIVVTPVVYAEVVVDEMMIV